MKLIRNSMIIVCALAAFLANAGDQPAGGTKCVTKQSIASEVRPLQGTWEGVMVGDNAGQKITMTITGNTLHFHRDTNFWFETSIALPEGKNPKQLHATIKKCPPSQESSIGQVVRAFFKIEAGTLVLATMGDDTEETEKGFEASGTRYEFRKIDSQKKKVEPSKTDEPENAMKTPGVGFGPAFDFNF